MRKHAVAAAGGNSYAYDANGNMSTRNGAAITWTSYNLPATLSASGYTASFNYAPDRSRWRQIATYTGSTETTIYVAGLVEKLTTSVRVHWKHRIAVPSGEVQVVRRSDGTNDVFYITTDHLGSTDTVTDAAANVLARESFGAWGARRSSTWQGSPSPGEWQQIANTTRRGYTGHEQLDNVLLVHMNGRVYDPAIGRFMSADPHGGGFDASQSWNRYAYVSNRPLTLVDPTGLIEEVVVTATRIKSGFFYSGNGDPGYGGIFSWWQLGVGFRGPDIHWPHLAKPANPGPPLEEVVVKGKKDKEPVFDEPIGLLPTDCGKSVVFNCGPDSEPRPRTTISKLLSRCEDSGKLGRRNNPNLQDNVNTGAKAGGVTGGATLFIIVLVNVAGFPEAEGAELMAALAGEPFISRAILGAGGDGAFGAGSGSVFGYQITKPMPPPCPVTGGN